MMNFIKQNHLVKYHLVKCQQLYITSFCQMPTILFVDINIKANAFKMFYQVHSGKLGTIHKR